MRIIITLALAALLAACGSPTKLHFGDKENPSRITSVEGLESHDAANVLTNKDYIDGKVKAPQKAIVSMKAHPGQTIEIKAAEFTVWQPTGPQDDIRPAPQAKSTTERNLDAAGTFVQKVTPALAIGAALSDRKDARAAATEQSRIEAETERARDAAQAAQAGELIDALREKPQFFVLPAGAAPVATPTE